MISSVTEFEEVTGTHGLGVMILNCSFDKLIIGDSEFLTRDNMDITRPSNPMRFAILAYRINN